MTLISSKPPTKGGGLFLGAHPTVARAPGAPDAPKKPGKLLIHLDLTELIEIEYANEGTVGGKHPAFVKAEVLNRDADRPKRVLAKVRKIFEPLAGLIDIELGTSAGSADRRLKARFGYPLHTDGKLHAHETHGQYYDPAMIGNAAQAISRSKGESWKALKGDEKFGPTAYVFEGAIALVIWEFFRGEADVDNLYAAAIAHELGHNLGLTHTYVPADIMFIYGRREEKDQKAWMSAANENRLRFTDGQIDRIRRLLVHTK